MQIQHKLSSENVAYLNVDFLLCEDDVHVGGLEVGGNGMGVEMNSIQCPCPCNHRTACFIIQVRRHVLKKLTIL